MGADVSKDFGCCDCGLQQRSSILETEVNGVSSMKLHENNQRFLRAMAEGGKSDLILGLFSTTREFDVNAADESGETALHKAARNGHVICCHVLLKRGASPGIKNKEGKSALDLAQENEHAECVEYLKEPGYLS
jgi:ankyrin repeat protein